MRSGASVSEKERRKHSVRRGGAVTTVIKRGMRNVNSVSGKLIKYNCDIQGEVVRPM